jgi:hypothetical protein
LVVSVIPYVYAFSLYAAYEQLFMRIGFRNDSRPQRLRAKLAVVLGLRFRIRKVSAFAGSWLYQVAQTDSLRAALGVVKAFRKHQVQEIDAATAAANRLRDLARVQGTDDQGRQLDRREFTQTQAALRWLAVCQMGRHNNDGRYKADLAMVLDFSSSGLSEPHGVEMLVRTGGQAWFGWRRTITGWCFAIGAAGPTPDQWLFDGPEPPRGFPGEDPVWGEQAFVDDHAPNWD